MIKIKHLSYKYRYSKSIILDDLSFECDKGQITLILGKNGSGKSTLAKIISGLIKVNNKYIEKDGIVRMVFQNPDNQLIFNNIYDELAFIMNKTSKDELNNIIDSTLKKLNIAYLKESDLSEVSGGEKQRIVIASILAMNPDYIIFDEATSMIDSDGKKLIYGIINTLKKDNIGIIWITNNSEEIIYGDKICILDKGKIKATILKKDLVSKINILEKYNISIPLIIKLAHKFKLNLKKYDEESLIKAIYEKFY